jgi:PAS domain S-box-containing protein
MGRHLTKPVTAALDFVRAAFSAAVETGDLIFACYCCDHTLTNLLARGDHLDEVWRVSEQCLDFVRKAKSPDYVDRITTQRQFMQNMRGWTNTFSTFSDLHFDEAAFEAQLPVGRANACWYWILKLQVRFISGDYETAIAAAQKAKLLLWGVTGCIQLLDYYYYNALAIAAVIKTAPPDRQSEWRETLTAHMDQLREWAESCAPTFLDKHALVGAEIARVDSRDVDAMHLYEQAIRFARENGFIHNEGIANEVAGKFYLDRGFETIAHTYFRNARYCYLRWGATGKVRQLDGLYPYLAEEEPVPAPTSTIGAPIEHLDFATVIRVSQAVSSEIVLEKLIDTLMRTTIEHAGAERGLLILSRGVERWIEAEAITSGDAIFVRLREALVAETEVPASIVHYVVRTQESVILDDASTHNPFSADTYLRLHHARSILCLPLINQAKLIGALYLENNLTPHVFTPTRIAVLKLLASQAAISLENTRLYHDLEKREAKIRRLVDANIMGIFMWNFEGQIIEANEAFLHMVGYSREDLVSGRLSWKDLTPPEWRDLTERAAAQLKATGILQPYEKEYFRNDGSRVPVLVGSAVFEKGQNDGVSFVLDLSEQKRAEEALRRSQAHLAEAQAELAHVTRVTALGELTASIAHEINQPLAAVVTNANASLRWLSGDSPNVAEAQEAIRRIIRDGNRAADVISRMRSLFKKASAAKERLDTNGVIEEVIVLAQSELQRNRILLQTQLANDLPLIMGDRIQLQQLILNLLINAIEAMSAAGEGPRELWVSSQKVTANPGESEQDTLEGKALAAAECTDVLIAVRDSGKGLDPKGLNRLFDAFYTTKPQGLGMGLAICRSIVEAHGGRLWATANASRGAVFQFTMPIRDERMS